MARTWLVSLAFVFAAAASAQTTELKLSTAVGPAYALGRAGERWAQLLTDGGIAVRAFPGAVVTLRDPLREFGALRDGEADLAVGTALAWSAQLPAFAVYGLPWLAPEREQQEALAADASVRERVAAEALRADVVVVHVAPLAERVLSTSKTAVESPAQASGLRLRASNVPVVLETFAALGARAESLPAAAAQAAFAASTLDGQEAWASTLAATRVAASGQRVVTRWGAFADVMIFAVRKPVWDAWSEAQRVAVRAAAIEAARDAGASSREDAALGELTRQGVTIVRLAPPQRAAFRAVVDSVWSKWRGALGAEAVDAALAATKR
jgi:TRAP-type C4-dicarboxylate transport system substrate-binding protein